MIKKLLFIVLLLTSNLLVGQISFYKQFSNNGYDYGEGITQMADSSYLITGSSSSFFEGPAQAFILKLDSLGNFIWSKHFGGAEADGGKRIMSIENDGILVAGMTNSIGAGAYDFYLFKTDLEGNLLWENSFGTASWDRVYDAALTRDSGVIMVGETLNTTDGESDMLIVRTDRNGNELWSQQIGNNGPDVLHCMTKVNDSTFAIAGKVYVADSAMHKAYIGLMHEDGNMLWQDTILFQGNSQFNGICTNYTDVSLVGETNYGNNETSSLNYKCNLIGVTSVFYIEENAEIDKLMGVSHLGSSDKYAVAMSYDNQFSYGGFDLDIRQYYGYMGYNSVLGEVRSSEDVFFGQLIATNDLGVIMVGHYDNVGIGGSNIFVMKVREDNANIITSTATEDIFNLVSTSVLIADSKVSIFPNPASSSLFVRAESTYPLTFRILDFTGRLIKSGVISNSSFLDISDINSGSYFISVESENRLIGTANIVVSN